MTLTPQPTDDRQNQTSQRAKKSVIAAALLFPPKTKTPPKQSLFMLMPIWIKNYRKGEVSIWVPVPKFTLKP